MAVTIYQYPACSTCRKALKWLTDGGVTYDSVDLVKSPPSASQLRDLVRRSGQPVSKFFNTSGQSYRAGNFKEKLKTMTEDEAIAALANDGKLIKRPLIDVGGKAVLVGFDQAAYRSTLAR